MTGSKSVQRFEDLHVWQKARELNRQIYLATKTTTFARDFALRDQIRRASISVMSNLAEGFDRGSRNEFQRFVAIAKGSCAEVQSQLYAAMDIGYMTSEQCKSLLEQAKEVSRMLGGLRRSLKEGMNS